MLRATGLYKSYPNIQVLNGVNLEVRESEIVSIVGASGAGKSTLLQILGTLDKADRGEIVIDNTIVSQLTTNQLSDFRNKSLGFIFQFHNLLPEFTAFENVCIPGYLGKKVDKDVQERATFLLEFMGLKDRMHHRPNEMSGGEQQRTAIARALINSPALILADEPTGNLDAKNAEEVHQLFIRLREDFKQTFVIVTHNEKLITLTDRTLYMKGGIIEREHNHKI